ncbi:MAG TPA: amidohydrolase family protein, partial [Acidimicrobiales bacterium]|nr:amidohydrolase family protein [Acidimicrobiales bacterium]
MLTLIEGGDVYAPEHLGECSILLVDGKIGKVGDIDRAAVESIGIEVQLVEAHGCMVCPGFIDPHQHLLGGSGEEGFATQSPEIHLSEIVTAGITTVVGTLGVDTTMKTMAGLLAKAKALKEEGISAYVWSGGYSVPPASILGSIREDMMFIEEVIGCGELAIADERALEPTPQELARVVSDTRQGGKLSKKSGITHFHVGPGKRRMRCIEEMLDDDRFEVDASWLYPTHIGRSEALMRDAIALTKRGCHVDLDVQEEDLSKWLRFYVDHHGDIGKLTVSSDASIKGPLTLFAQVRAAARGRRLPMEKLLSLVTSNTADVLKLERKGRIAVGRDGDLLVLEKDEFELVHVLARGKPMVRD